MYESSGVELLLMLVQVAALPHDKVMQTIDLFGKQVIPKLSAKTRAQFNARLHRAKFTM